MGAEKKSSAAATGVSKAIATSLVLAPRKSAAHTVAIFKRDLIISLPRTATNRRAKENRPQAAGREREERRTSGMDYIGRFNEALERRRRRTSTCAAPPTTERAERNGREAAERLKRLLSRSFSGVRVTITYESESKSTEN